MRIVEILAFGEAYYSGATYNESVFLLEDDYMKLNVDIDGEEIGLGELDGKHSDVYGDVEVVYIEEKDQQKHIYSKDNDGDILYCYISDLAYDENMKDEFIKMIGRANDYISSIDCLVEATFTVKKSLLEKINKLIEENKDL